MKYIRPIGIPGFLAILTLSACGGGGGGDSGGVTPPPVTTVTYTVQLRDIGLVDSRTAAAVNPTGLPINGAQATRSQ